MCACLGKVWKVSKHGKVDESTNPWRYFELGVHEGRRIFEINFDHPIIKDLNGLQLHSKQASGTWKMPFPDILAIDFCFLLAACQKAPESNDAKKAVELLYDTTLVSSGFSPDSPAELGNKIYEMMMMAPEGRWGRVEEGSDASEDDPSEFGTSAGGVSEPQVVEPSEGRTKSDPWED
ncbi:hypothetical protein Ancab_018659 [Ancistrocladus abbreviatus]